MKTRAWFVVWLVMSLLVSLAVLPLAAAQGSDPSLMNLMMTVPVDIKPTSCWNPLNVDEKGVLPTAILGDADFDVAHVDPASVRLQGVAPLRWAWEDVATPFEPYVGKYDAYDCTDEGPDGYMDLTLKFDAREVIAALGEVSDGDVLVLSLTGNLKAEFGGYPFVGEDVIVILRRQM